MFWETCGHSGVEQIIFDLRSSCGDIDRLCVLGGEDWVGTGTDGTVGVSEPNPWMVGNHPNGSCWIVFYSTNTHTLEGGTDSYRCSRYNSAYCTRDLDVIETETVSIS